MTRSLRLTSSALAEYNDKSGDVGISRFNCSADLVPVVCRTAPVGENNKSLAPAVWTHQVGREECWRNILTYNDYTTIITATQSQVIIILEIFSSSTQILLTYLPISLCSYDATFTSNYIKVPVNCPRYTPENLSFSSS